MAFWLDSGMHDVVIALVRAMQTSSQLCRSFILNERDSQKTPQNVWLKPYLAQLLTCRISRQVECVTFILFPSQKVLGGGLQLHPHSAQWVVSVSQSDTLNHLIFTCSPECFNQNLREEWAESHRESQQTNLSVRIVQHGNQRWDAFQATHIRLDLGSKMKRNRYYKNNFSRASDKENNSVEHCKCDASEGLQL